MGQRKMEQQVKRVMITEAEFLRDWLQAHDPSWIRTMMEQFAPEDSRQNCGRRGWLWPLSDGSGLILNDDNKLIAAPPLRHL